MAEPPPKKIGSLRDRIAAFETKGSVPASASPPVPRPKPANVQWKPRPTSPPPPAEENVEKHAGGMSAADAKESIVKAGGSLKERMAALQGRGAFGGAAPAAPPPRPTGEKPKWKPPPVVSPPADEEGREPISTPAEHPISPPADVTQASSGDVESAHAQPAEAEGSDEQVKDPGPEEEERQRRAAIAARMARLGGARVGMAPPIFGKKPDVPPKKVDTPKAEEHKKESNEHTQAATEKSPAPEVVQTPPIEDSGHVEQAQVRLGGDMDESTTSLLSPDSGTSSAPRSPSMPVLAVPRRAAPPRRKTPKSPSPAPAPHVLEGEVTSESPASTPLAEEDAKSKELQEDVKKSKEDEVALGLSVPPPVPPPTATVTSEGQDAGDRSAAEDAEAAAYASALTEALEEHLPAEEPSHTELMEREEIFAAQPSLAEPEESVPHEEPRAPTKEPAAEQEQEEAEEEDAATRRARIADRLRQQGGFNPFSAPPMRKPSLTSPEVKLETENEEEEEVVHPTQEEHAQEAVSSPTAEQPRSVRRDSSDSNVLPSSPALTKRTSLRQDSVSSIPESPPPVPAATKPGSATRRDSTTSIGSVGSEASAKHSSDGGHDTNVNVNRKRMSILSQDVGMQPVSEEVVEEPETVASDEEAGREYMHGELEEFDEYEQYEERAPEAHEVHEDTVPESPSSPVTRAILPGRKESLNASIEPLLHQPRTPAIKRTSLPPPPRAPPSVPQEADNLYSGATRSIPGSIAPPPVPIDQHVEDISCEAEEEAPEPPRRPSSRRSIPPPPLPEPEEQHLREGVPPAASVRRVSLNAPPKRRSIPPPLPPPEPPAEEVEEQAYGDDEAELTTVEHSEYSEYSEADIEHVEELEEETPPAPPRRASVPAPRSPVTERAPPPVTSPRPECSVTISPLSSPVSARAGPPAATHEEDIYDDSDGDPIDPTFYSPQKSSSSVALTARQSPVVPTAEVASLGRQEPAPPVAASFEQAEDEEQTRKRTIAERMAKLGGIRFGAPVPPTARAPPPPPAPRAEEAEEHEEPAQEQEAPEAPEEEDEAARKQRIAARIAGMGGMRFGMLPTPMAPSPPVSKQTQPQSEEDVETLPPPPPPRATRPPVPPPAPPVDEYEADEDQSVSDGVQVEAEESEIEEVSHADAEEAPPVPTREGRRPSSSVPAISPRSPPVPFSSRPPIPVGRPSVPPTPSLATRPPISQMQTDYVMVEEPDVSEELPPPPPPRISSQRRAPPRTALQPPHAPGSMQESAESTNSQWEGAVDFGGETDLSLSAQWSEDSTQYPPSRSPMTHSQPFPVQPASAPSSVQPVSIPAQMSADDLMAQWGRVGVQIHEIATTLYEKSRRSPIGDGSHIGFITTVLRQVPNALQPAPPFDVFGYLIYEQSGPSVTRRASDIMPGDIIVLQDAKLKGHKGLQIYHQNVGIGSPLCAIIGDHEVKKSKVRVFQANQHVGQESVESISYRLDDLKNGIVKIFRVLEA